MSQQRRELKIYDLKKKYIKFRRTSTPNDPIISKLNALYDEMNRVEKEMEVAMKPFLNILDQFNNEEDKLVDEFWNETLGDNPSDEKIDKIEDELSKSKPKRFKAFCSDSDSDRY